jgi:hypothetical protein
MPKTERKHRAETLVQKARRSENWGNDPVYLEWLKAHREYRRLLKAREERKRFMRRVVRRGLYGALRLQRGSKPAPSKSADRYLPKTHPLKSAALNYCPCHLPRKHRRTKPQRADDKASELRQQAWDTLRQREWQADRAKLRRELGLDRPLTEAPASSTAPAEELQKEAEERRTAEDRRTGQQYREQLVWRIYGDL